MSASDSASLSSSDSDSYNSADWRTGSPILARPWKHLEHPDDDEWLRGPREVYYYPNLGDFVVLSIDPVATVGHLDVIAKQAARRLPVRQYVALAMEVSRSLRLNSRYDKLINLPVLWVATLHETNSPLRLHVRPTG